MGHHTLRILKVILYLTYSKAEPVSGMVGSLLITELQICCRICQWKNVESKRQYLIKIKY